MAMIDISSYKTDIMADIINCAPIVGAVESKSERYDPGAPDTLIYANIFPYLRIPETQNNTETYILIAVDMENVNRVNAAYCDIRITMWVMAHQWHMAMPDKNATRIDYISQELKKLFEGQRKYGFNKLELISNREHILNEKYQYRELIFVTNDLRQPANALRQGG